MFVKFETQEERREQGGADFFEIQYCRHPQSTSENIIVDDIRHWALSSLYVYGDDMNSFYEEYSGIFCNGRYNNMEEGTVDLYGVNYYNREKTKAIMERLGLEKPKGWQILLEWLMSEPDTNGFYVLGV